jgi:dihydrofolate reductase
MRKLILKMQVSVDGFVNGPNGELDWVFTSMDSKLTEWIVNTLWQAGVHIMGAATYKDMAAFWPNPSVQPPEHKPFAAPMNEIPKVVFSKTLKEATWADTTIARGDLRDEITRLKQQPGKPIVAHGGARFAQSLARLDLIDEYALVTHPVALGGGSPLFMDLPRMLDLKLESATPFPSGVVAHVYRR